MIKRLLLIALLCAGPALPARAVDGVEFDLRISQLSPSGTPVLLLADTISVLKGISATGFFINMSLDFDVLEVDTARTRFQLHGVTLAAKPENLSREFAAEFGLPAHLDNIAGKNDTRLNLQVTPLRLISVDTTGCGYSQAVAGTFKKDPAAYFDIHFVPQTLADFYWNSISSLIDERYREFRDLNKFSLPGKYEIFLAPCRIYSVLWDDRFGTMVDPTRMTAYAVYNHQFNSADPFLMQHVSVMKNYGYAPPMLSEGLAGYLSLAIFDMKRILRENQSLTIDQILDTYPYLTTDPLLADRMASTFVRFLVNQYGITQFLDVYREADDLNIRPVLERIFEKPLAQLDAEWRVYVDTVSLNLTNVSYYAEVAETMLQFPVMLRYAKAMVSEIAQTRNDSLQAYPYLVRAEYLTGDYYAATDYQRTFTQIDTVSVRNLVALAAYQMMNGEYTAARDDLETARKVDSTNQLLLFNLGLNELFQSRRDAARELFEKTISATEPQNAQIEARIFLSQLLLQRGSQADIDRARTLCYEVIRVLEPEINGGQATPYAFLWTGIASLGVGDLPTAWDYLQLAGFIEVRPFYLGMINLWLGKVSDMRGEHEVAREYYGKVLRQASADYHQKEARFLLDNPFELTN
jgi:tetratricopeptide (TPR) repeat protein